MELSFSGVFLKVLELSRSEALRTGWHSIRPDHITLGILRLGDCPACDALVAAGADPALFKEHLDECLFCPDQIPWEERETIQPCESAVSMMQHAALEARRCGSPEVEPLHFLLACCRIAGSYSHDWLAEQGIGLRALVEASGMEWRHYGLSAGQATDGTTETAAPDPSIMAAAIEQRLREGYSTGNPIVS